jgi:methionyl aminopeptidase
MNILSELLSQSPQPSPAKKQRRAIEIKSQREIAIMRQAGKIVATVLKEISELVQPGMTTADLDVYAEKRIREMGAVPSLKGIEAFPPLSVPALIMKLYMASPTPKE